MNLWAILWTDDDKDPHLRLLDCTEAEADAAFDQLRSVYSTADGGGFRNSRLLVVSAQVPATIAEEVNEWLATE